MTSQPFPSRPPTHPEPTKGYDLVKKSESPLMQAISILFAFFVPNFMRSFWTTLPGMLGRRGKIYVPSKYDVDLDWGSEAFMQRHHVLITHELVHLAQAERWGAFAFIMFYLGPAALMIPIVLGAGVTVLLTEISTFWFWGPLAAALAFLPLSVGLAFGRYRFECEAYLVQVDDAYRRRGTNTGRRTVEWVTDTLSGSNYLWTSPRSWIQNYFRDRGYQ